MTMYIVIPVAVELVWSDLHRMPPNDIGDSERFVEKIETGRIYLEFCFLDTEIWSLITNIIL
jgi:hypothetical protein